MKSAGFALVVAALAAAGLAQQPKPTTDPPRIGTEVEYVNVDAVVLDKQGRPIMDLTAADFTVLEDGVKQEIANFEAIELPITASATPAPAPVVSSNLAAGDRR